MGARSSSRGPRRKRAETAESQGSHVEAPEAQRPRCPVVGLGASAGGLEALEAFFKTVPNDTGLAFVVVVHLAPEHGSILSELIQRHTQMQARVVTDGMTVEPDTIYVIPPNKDLVIRDGKLYLEEFEHPRGLKLPIDGFFRSLAIDRGDRAVGIVLSGTGTDGTLGVKAIKGETGMVMVQTEESAKYDGMPRSAISTGVADFVLPPEKMPEQLVKYIRHRVRRPEAPAPVEEQPHALQRIFALLRARTDHDFSLYKKNTICRRIERRMAVHQVETIEDYVRYLQRNEGEINVLFKELLINVTTFFRDGEAFEALRHKVLMPMVRDKPEDATLRVWVPACSSGEEAYSLAMEIQECMEEADRRLNVQVFGTDIDADAIQIARGGLYPPSIAADVDDSRLRRFFTREDDGKFRIKKHIREMVVFAPQNVVKAPPFTKLDLLSCRNLLIYLGSELQKKLLPIFHYSLKPEGILFLGPSETIGQATDLFAMVDKKWKIYRCKAAPAAHPTLEFPTGLAAAEQEAEPPQGPHLSEESHALHMVESILRQSDAPPCAVVDEAGEVLYVHGRTGRYLEPPQGRFSGNVLEMARPGLKAQLAEALRRAAVHKQPVVKGGLRVEHNGGALTLDLTVKPLVDRPELRGLILVIFREARRRGEAEAAEAAESNESPPAGHNDTQALAQELQHTREDLQTTIEELETSNEELKSTNEELQSANEELQSTNEELETSKEELQSLNEEAATINAELQARIDELSKANDDMKNLLDSTDIATLFLDAELRVRRFTPRATDLIPLTGGDIGRPLKHFATTLADVNLGEQARRVLEDLAMREVEVHASTGHTYALRTRPYRTLSNRIDGVVMTFQDITERKKSEVTLAHMAALVAQDPNPILRIRRDGTILYANDAAASLLKAWGCDVGGRAPDTWRQHVEQSVSSGQGRRMDVEHDGRNLAIEIVPVAENDHANLYATDTARLAQAAKDSQQ
ncbi:MAG: PAS domain-containing protein, partial [Planctomycetes bacterium]|nr:PAS domain-containing protein [Planctomycetota bacterium]